MIDLGSPYVVAVDVFGADGNPANPATASLVITLPDGSTVSPGISLPPPVTGQLRATYITTMSGRHTYRMVTSAPVTVYTGEFDVADQVPPSILSLSDAKRQLGINPADTTDDDELRGIIAGMTVQIETYKHEVVVARQFVEDYQFDPWSWNWTTATPRLRLLHVPVITFSSLVSWDGNITWDTVNNLRTDLDTGLVTVVRGTPITGQVTATYTSGYRVVPYHYRMGALLLLQHLWESRRGPGGVDGLVGPEELGDYRHFTAFPRKVVDALGPPRPVVM